MFPDDGGWVDGFDKDGEHFKRLKEEGTSPPHHEKWAEALEKALQGLTDGWEQGQTGEFTLTRQVRVSKQNPGWVDGYKINLGGG
jgi:hypothetical protein